MASSKINKEIGVNYDYILALSSNDGILSVEKIDITRHDEWIDEMIEMYENENRTASDMHQRACKLIRYTGYTYPFCLGHSYYDTYINDVEFPNFNVGVYNNYIYDRITHIGNLLKLGYTNSANREQNKLNAYIKDTKEEYLKRILPYIYSYDYQDTLSKYNIKAKFKLFSSEIHGRFTYETVVNENLKILTRTNFCYGSSSCFHIIVKYKDIELLPLSEWVKYYYAGYNAITQFTRSYFCTRDSWTYAMNFLEGFVNKAIENPDEFVKKDVLSEVDGLMNGLENILQMSDDGFENILDVQHIAEDDDRYIGISSARHANERERENYKIKKSESAMIYKMEKISGALYFLNNLKSISSIYPEVKDSINRILELNESIYPDVVQAIPPIDIEIKNLTITFQQLGLQYKQKQKQFDFYKKRLDGIKQKSNVTDFKEIEEKFKKDNPQFEILAKETSELWNKQNKYFGLINDREDVKKRLISYKELIEKNKKS